MRYRMLSFVLVALFACNANDPTTSIGSPALARVRANASVLAPNGTSFDTISIGETTQLTTTINNAKWSSRAPSVASVTSSGLVTGVSQGQTYVIASKGQQRDSARITVQNVVQPPVGITIALGMNADSATQANPPGTTFVFAPGTHVRQSVRPKSGNTYLGTGAVLDGENATTYAFHGRTGSVWADNVTIKHVRVTRYLPPAQLGAITAGEHNAWPDATSGWAVDSVEVHHNANVGVRIGTRMRVLRSNLHHNGTINVGGVGRAVVVDGIESSYANDGCPNDPGFESGGTKFVLTDSLVVRNSFFHHNCGVGLWLDIDNINYVLENNRVEDNVREGICVEISYAGVIRNNQVARNGWPTDPYRGNGWGWDAGIGVHASPNVEVYGNTLTENFNGIVGLQQARGSGTLGSYVLENLHVHDNTVYQRVAPSNADGGFAGAIVQDIGDTSYFTSRNNRWANNTYFIGGNPWPFAWMNGIRTASQWQSFGNDVTGTFNP